MGECRPNLVDHAWTHVTPPAKLLVVQMLQLHPKKRPDAGKVTQSPWILKELEQMPASPKTLIGRKKMIERLQNYRRADKFRRAALNIIAHHLDDAQITKLRDTFLALDKNGDGTIEREELKSALVFEEGPDPEMDDAFRAVDVDGSGTISYSEFLQANLTRTHLREQECWFAFREIDKDGDGLVNVAELYEKLREDPLVDKRTAEQLLREADVNGDGYVDFAEFMTMLSKGLVEGTPGSRRHAAMVADSPSLRSPSWREVPA